MSMLQIEFDIAGQYTSNLKYDYSVISTPYALKSKITGQVDTGTQFGPATLSFDVVVDYDINSRTWFHVEVAVQFAPKPNNWFADKELFNRRFTANHDIDPTNNWEYPAAIGVLTALKQFNAEAKLDPIFIPQSGQSQLDVITNAWS